MVSQIVPEAILIRSAQVTHVASHHFSPPWHLQKATWSCEMKLAPTPTLSDTALTMTADELLPATNLIIADESTDAMTQAIMVVVIKDLAKTVEETGHRLLEVLFI